MYSQIVSDCLEVYTFFLSNDILRLIPVMFLFPVVVYGVFSIFKG